MLTGQKLLEDINNMTLPSGGVAFWWLGQLSFVVKVEDTVFYFDPYLAPNPRRRVPPLLSPEEVTNADWVFCSHDHGDHLDKVAIPGIAAASPQARFVCSKVASKRMTELNVPQDRVVTLDEGLVHEQAGVRISAIAAAHEFFDRDAELGYPYLGFIVEANGVTILHTGDTLRYDGIAAKLSPWKFDLAFMPINGRDAVRYARGTLGNMTYQEAVDLAGDLRPRLTMPGHYEMFEHNSADPKLFADYMDVKFPGLSYWIGGHGEAVVLPPRNA
jgi:L-ascorbate metabolism protein UlaG (beta-lactamase superfamily)